MIQYLRPTSHKPCRDPIDATADITAGPIDAFVIRIGTPLYEPRRALLKASAPDYKIIASARAGYNEFDVKPFLYYLATKAECFYMKIKYYNRNQLPKDEEVRYGATYCKSLCELLASSDVISLNYPLDENTTNLIGEAEFAAIKDGVFRVNTARGTVIDEKGLIAAVEGGKVTRAGLDILINEPNPYTLISCRVTRWPSSLIWAV